MLVESLPKPPMPALDKVGLTGGDVAWIVPHQAQSAIFTATAHAMQVPMEGGFCCDGAGIHGNTSAASTAGRLFRRARGVAR